MEDGQYGKWYIHNIAGSHEQFPTTGQGNATYKWYTNYRNIVEKSKKSRVASYTGYFYQQKMTHCVNMQNNRELPFFGEAKTMFWKDTIWLQKSLKLKLL